MNNTPKFIWLHCNSTEIMVNIQNINFIRPYNDTMCSVYTSCRNDPIVVDESYNEIKSKLQHLVWFV
jgi:hypothetical protein